jgi:hypothetical protein
MRSLYYAVAAAAAVFTISSSANAAVITLAPGPDGYLSGNFGADVNGDFSAEYTFTVPGDGLISAGFLTSNVSVSPGLSFLSVTLNGVALTPVDLSPNFAFSITDQSPIVGIQTLLLVGSGVGSYGGAVSFAPFDTGGNPQAVPEPASWALMLGGFGMMGATLRGNRRNKVAVTFG